MNSVARQNAVLDLMDGYFWTFAHVYDDVLSHLESRVLTEGGKDARQSA